LQQKTQEERHSNNLKAQFYRFIQDTKNLKTDSAFDIRSGIPFLSIIRRC